MLDRFLVEKSRPAGYRACTEHEFALLDHTLTLETHSAKAFSASSGRIKTHLLGKWGFSDWN